MAERWEELAALIAAGHTMVGAAKALGVSEQTAFGDRRKAGEAFYGRVSELRTEKIRQATGLLAESVEDAITSLRTLSKDAARDSDKIAACKALLANLMPMSENLELRQRLHDLERRIMEQAGEAGGDSPSPAAD